MIMVMQTDRQSKKRKESGSPLDLCQMVTVSVEIYSCSEGNRVIHRSNSWRILRNLLRINSLLVSMKNNSVATDTNFL